MFPSVLNTFTYPNPTDRLNSPSHSSLHNATSSILGQVQAVIGVEGTNSVVGSLQYLIKSPASDGGGHVQTASKGGTGQTSYNKGDLLVASSSSVLTKLVVGTEGQILKVNSSLATGIGWATAGFARVYTSNDTWFKPSTLTGIEVICVGGGGGGGAGVAGQGGGGGGGGGAYNSRVFPASMLNVAVSVLVAGSVASGTNGEGSHFGSLLSAFGGTAGQPGNVRNGGSGGSSGVSSVTGNAISGQGGGTNGGNAEEGGGGGENGRASNQHTGVGGGGSLKGGGGGGGGSYNSSIAGKGGVFNTYSSAGISILGAAVNGVNGSYFSGGGGGTGMIGNGTPGNGGNGGVAGGGGGGGCSDNAGGSGGSGGRGEVIVIEF